MISSILIKTKRKEGFTLIELLVVIAIIGTLSTIGFIALTQSQQGANDAVKVSELQTIRSALNLNYINTTAFPVPSTTANKGAGTCQLGNAAGGLSTALAGKIEGIDWSKYTYCTNKANTVLVPGTTAKTIDNTEYVVGIKLDAHHKTLDDDTDGTVGATDTFDCTQTDSGDSKERAFCLRGTL